MRRRKPQHHRRRPCFTGASRHLVDAGRPSFDASRALVDAGHRAVAFSRSTAAQAVRRIFLRPISSFFRVFARTAKKNEEPAANHALLVSSLYRGARRRSNGAPPEELNEERDAKAQAFEELRAETADDPEVRAIVDLIEEGVHEPALQAQRLGVGIEVVRKARKRLTRRVKARAGGADEDDEDEEPP